MEKKISNIAIDKEQQQAFMREAIRLASQNVETQGGGPFGAVVVKEGKIIAAAANHVTTANDPTAHAEINAIREACKRLNTFDLQGCEIYASCEPCPMCLASIYWAHIDKIYYAGTRHDAEMAGFGDSFIYNELAKSMEERTVPIIKLLHDEGVTPLQKWQECTNRVEY
ncbi:MAG: nucleoside deaminase [Bacteroidales bacterium]|jgi:tRNA(Arg) A34 adenosine deaminase TadA|nr:nucleoside deaminase [Bacteroidales bacterium]